MIVLSDLLSSAHTTQLQHFNIESLVSVCVGMSVALAAYSSHQCIHDRTRHPARLSFTPQTGSSVMRDRIVRSALRFLGMCFGLEPTHNSNLATKMIILRPTKANDPLNESN